MRKNTMHKLARSISILLILIVLGFTLSSCSVTVTFDADGGTVVDGTLVQEVSKDSEVTPPTLEKEGYYLAGWDGNYKDPEEDVTVKAIWEPLTNVIFDAEGGTLNDATLGKQSVRDLEDVKFPTATKDKYIFKKWKKTEYPKSNSVTYSAVWERKTFTATEIHAMANPATVEIHTYRRNNIPIALGSGFFIDDSGTVVTNYHVIEDAYEIIIKLYDSTEYTVLSIVSYDKAKDIAILKADLLGQKVEYLELAHTSSQVGEAVYALGSSLGLTGTFSSGIVSYVNREVDNVKFIQSTAPISSGNSGGPLINEKGYVIGINTATYTEGQNLNLSVSVYELKSLKEQHTQMYEFFKKTCIYPYYVGEFIVNKKENGYTADILQNGYTASASLYYEDLDIYFTQVDSNAKYILAMVAVDDPTECLYTPPIPVASRSTDTANLVIKEEDIEVYYMDGYDGKYICMTIAKISEEEYQNGYIYYGAIVAGANEELGTYNYQCMICTINETTYKNITE